MLLDRLMARPRPLADADAFSGFYESAHLELFRFLMAMLNGDQDEAEDITAEAFLKAWKNRHRFEGDRDAAFGWVLTIARHILIDRYRGLSVRFTEEPLEEALAAEMLTAEEIVMENEKIEAMLQALHSVPGNQRELIILRYVLGWRVNQIAEFFNISENTVSVVMSRALKRIQPMLAGNGGLDESQA